MKIYLIRHGETTGDVEGRYGGTYDDYLSEKGIKQVKELAEELKDKGIEIIYSSPYHRAKDTAEILSKVLKCPIKIKKDIREKNVYGFMSGKLKSEMEQKYPDQVKIAKNYRLTVRGGEKYSDFKKRLLRAFDEIADSDYKTIAIITHGGPIRCFYREVLSPSKEIEPSDCAVIEMEKNGKNKIIHQDGIEFK